MGCSNSGKTYASAFAMPHSLLHRGGFVWGEINFVEVKLRLTLYCISMKRRGVRWCMMKRHKICKSILIILTIFLCVALYELLGICIAYKKQPEVSNTTRKETQNDSWNEHSENMERAVIIEKNSEALLQRVRLIQNAKEKIILSTFAFQLDESGKLILGAFLDAADRGV